MATANGVLGIWMVFESAGLARPWVDDDEIERAVHVWAAVLGDIDDERLAEMAMAWLRSPESRFGKWPLPGALLAALPPVSDIDDADEAWSEALGLLAWRGRDRCPLTVDEFETLRAQIVAAMAKASDDPDRHHRLSRALAKLPRQDNTRTEALLAGIRACGGWRVLGSCEEEAMVAHRASFRNVYRSHRQRHRLTDSERRVAGLIEPHLKLIPGCKP